MRSIAISMTMTLALVAQGCGPAAVSHEAEQGSQVHFITRGPGVSGLVKSVKKKRLTICLSGVSEAERSRWTKDLESVVMKWVAPLRGMTSDRLVENVETVQRGQACDVDVSAAPGTHSNTTISDRPSVRMSPTGYFASYNVLFHEFGHAFALSDTYVNGTSGNCRAGQPQSLMCNTSFSELQTDDVKGVQSVFQHTFPRDAPPPPNTRNEPIAAEIFAALGQEVAGDTYEIYGASPASEVMAFCAGPKDLCDESETNWKPMRATRKVDKMQLHASGVAVKISDGSLLTLRQGSGAAAAYKEVTFKSR